MRALLLLFLTVVITVGTWFAGWLVVPAAAAGYALLRRDRRAPREAGVAALVAWTLLLVRAKLHPAFTTLLGALGQIFPLPGVAVGLLTLLFAVILAASAARLVTGLVGVSAEPRT